MPADREREELLQRLAALTTRLEEVEATLRRQVESHQRNGWRGRLRELTSPRLGALHQHAPEALRVPSSYLRTDPPSPAPRISVVTPTLGHERFIERTIYSVLSQAYPDLEYIVQDGGSDDGTAAVLDEYADRLAHWVSAPDAGQADAINLGFERSSGEIMAWLNSDDMLLPGALAYIARYFSEHPETDAVYGHRVLIDENDRQVGVWVLPPHDEHILEVGDFIPQETLFWRRRAWERAGGRMNPDLHYAMDWDLLLRLRESGARIVRLSRFLGAFRVHPDQKTQAGGPARDAEADAIRARLHGRAMTGDEAFARSRPYLRRHVVHHTLHRASVRLPWARSEVRTLPPNGCG